MSCWIVEPAHLDAMILLVIQEGIATRHPVTFRNATDVGRLLLTENNRSFTTRYQGRYDAELGDVDGYRFRGAEARIDRAAGLQAWECYAYQACEHPDYDTSIAASLCADVEVWGAANHITAAGPWRISSIEQVLAPNPAVPA